MAEIGSLWVKLGLKDAQFNKGMDMAQKKTHGLGQQIKSMIPLMAAFAAVSGLANLTKAIVNITSEFGSMMSRVQALSGANDQMTETLRKQAKTLGQETQFTATEAAEAMSFLAMAGLDVNQIYKAMPNALELAAAGQITLAEAADISTNIMSSYGLQAEDLGRVNDIIANTATNANTNVREFAEAFKMVGPVAKSANQSIEDVSASIGLLANSGIKGTMAGTALRTMMSKLIKPTGDAARILKKFAIETIDAATGNLRRLNDILFDMQEAGLGTADMFEIFDLRAAGAATVLKSASGTFDEFAKKVGISGTAARIAAKQMDNLKGDTLRLKSAWQGAMLSMGESGEGFMRNIAQMTTALINKLTPSITSSLDELKKLEISVAGVEDALPGLLSEYEKLSTKANKSEEENEKLRKVMDDIATIVPTAVTAWNNHGEALAINVTEAGRFMEVQKALLKLRNAEEIEKQEDALEGFGFAIKSITKELNEGKMVSGQMWALTADMITKAKEKLAEYHDKSEQTKLILAGLTGEFEKYGVVVPKSTEQTEAEAAAQKKLAEEIKAATKAKRLQIEAKAQVASESSLAESTSTAFLKGIEDAANAADEAFGELNVTYEDSMAGILAMADTYTDVWFPIIDEVGLKTDETAEKMSALAMASNFAFQTMTANAQAWAASIAESTARSGSGLKEFGNELRRAVKESIALMLAESVAAMVTGALKGTALAAGPFGFLVAPLAAAGAAAAANSAFEALIPSFATGIDNVPRDMLANVHEGEAIIPKHENRRGNNGGNVIAGEWIIRGEDLHFVQNEFEKGRINSL